MIEVILNDRLVRAAPPRAAGARSRNASRSLTPSHRYLASPARAGQEDSRQVQVRGGSAGLGTSCFLVC
jgi:hypothetical protein